MQVLRGDLGNVREELTKRTEQLHQVYDSHSYRMGNAADGPIKHHQEAQKMNGNGCVA